MHFGHKVRATHPSCIGILSAIKHFTVQLAVTVTSQLAFHAYTTPLSLFTVINGKDQADVT